MFDPSGYEPYNTNPNPYGSGGMGFAGANGGAAPASSSKSGGAWLPAGAPASGAAAAAAPSIGGASFGGYSGPMSFDYNLEAAPKFNPTVHFKAPTMEEAQNEPGYQFRLGAGQDALQHSAAAKGLLRSGGTLKDLINYGQNFASQEYGNVFDRSMKDYQAKYGQEKDMFEPQMAEWKTKAGMEQARALAGFNRELEASQMGQTAAIAHQNAIQNNL